MRSREFVRSEESVNVNMSINPESQLLSKKVMHRDQRTTAHRVLDNDVEERTSKSTMQQSNSQNNATHSECKSITSRKPMMDNQVKMKSQHNSYQKRSSRRRRREEIRTLSLMLSAIRKICFIITPLLLFSCLCTAVYAAPTKQMSKNHQFSDPPKWTNPCGHNTGNMVDDITTTAPQPSSDVELLERIVTQTRIALRHASTFFNVYVEKILKVHDRDLVKAWELTKYSFLPREEQVPKKLGGHVDPTHLQKLNFTAALVDIYEFLQMFAVGLEQIVIDEVDFRKDFQDIEDKLRMVLCELQSAIMERGVTQHPDVSRDIMDSRLREMPSQTDINVRNWVIFRDYLNTLEYANEVFSHLKKNIAESS